jgi:hypothetical protein
MKIDKQDSAYIRTPHQLTAHVLAQLPNYLRMLIHSGHERSGRKFLSLNLELAA